MSTNHLQLFHVCMLPEFPSSALNLMKSLNAEAKSIIFMQIYSLTCVGITRAVNRNQITD